MPNGIEDLTGRKDYYDRGICVCARWSGPEGYGHFLEDMGRRPSAQHSIDRKDNDGNYEKENCRWATRAEQSRNKRSSVLLTYKGVTSVAADWADRLGIHRRTLFHRLRKLSVKQALETPVRKQAWRAIAKP